MTEREFRALSYPALAELTDALLLIVTMSMGCIVMQHAAFSLTGDVIDFIRFPAAPMIQAGFSHIPRLTNFFSNYLRLGWGFFAVVFFFSKHLSLIARKPG